MPGSVEEINKSVTLTCHIVMFSSILQRECDVEIAPDVLDTERRITFWKFGISEGTYIVKICVEHFNSSKAEVGGKEKGSSSIATNSQPFVDRACTNF